MVGVGRNWGMKGWSASFNERAKKLQLLQRHMKVQRCRRVRLCICQEKSQIIHIYNKRQKAASPDIVSICLCNLCLLLKILQRLCSNSLPLLMVTYPPVEMIWLHAKEGLCVPASTHRLQNHSKTPPKQSGTSGARPSPSASCQEGRWDHKGCWDCCRAPTIYWRLKRARHWEMGGTWL